MLYPALTETLANVARLPFYKLPYEARRFMHNNFDLVEGYDRDSGRWEKPRFADPLQMNEEAYRIVKF